jgi:hypothetical protein
MKEFFKKIWYAIDPIVELGIYVGIAFLISKLVKISFISSIAIVFVYFTLNILRILVTIVRDKQK